jgi:hypothetical protein
VDRGTGGESGDDERGRVRGDVSALISVIPWLSLGLAAAQERSSPYPAKILVAWEDGAVIERVPDLQVYLDIFSTKGGFSLPGLSSAYLIYRSGDIKYLLSKRNKSFNNPANFSIEAEKNADPIFDINPAASRILWFLLRHLKAKINTDSDIAIKDYVGLSPLYIWRGCLELMGLPCSRSYANYEKIKGLWRAARDLIVRGEWPWKGTTFFMRQDEGWEADYYRVTHINKAVYNFFHSMDIIQSWTPRRADRASRAVNIDGRGFEYWTGPDKSVAHLDICTTHILPSGGFPDLRIPEHKTVSFPIEQNPFDVLVEQGLFIVETPEQMMERFLSLAKSGAPDYMDGYEQMLSMIGPEESLAMMDNQGFMAYFQA